MIEQPSKESDMRVSGETNRLSTAKPSSQRPFSRGDELPVISSRHLVLSLALLAIAITPSTAQNNCASTPPTGTCAAPSRPVQVWCAGNNSASTCPGGTSWVGYDTSTPSSGSWSGQFEGLDASSILASGKKVTPQPDPNGAVGPTNSRGVGQYLEFANGFVQAFDRATGNPIFSYQPNGVAKPQPLSELFVPGGKSYCGNASLDGIASYDRIDGTFILANLFHPGGNVTYYFCIGVSAPTGSVPANNLEGSHYQSNWNVYAYELNPALPQNQEGHAFFPDYARFGNWSDGFYVTWDLLDVDKNYDIVGFEVCQLDKADMIVGQSSNPPVCYTYIPAYLGSTNNSLIHTLLPADFEGSNPIPNNTAGEYFIALVNPSNPGTDDQCNIAPCISHQLAFWTWRGFVGGLPPAYITFLHRGYTPGCYDRKFPYLTFCVPEPYGGHIDGLGDRLMYRLAYRYITGQTNKEYLAVTHTIQESAKYGRTGIRYYKILAGENPSIAYAGDIQDTTNLYFLSMPSVAMDKNGDLGITYTATGNVVHGSVSNYDPSPYFVTVDSAGTQGTPVPILTNSGSSGQDETDDYWGEYVSVSSDPNDDLTFWAVDEYMNGDQTGSCSFSIGTGCTWATRVYTCQKGSGC
jgi:hypothetical protein